MKYHVRGGAKLKTAAIYCRVSTDNQETEGTSLQTQIESCLNYCHDRGYDVSFRFSEAYSGLSLERPKLNELRELVRNEHIDTVVYCLDRLSRDPTHGVILTQEFERHGVTLEAVTETVDSSELGKLISYIRGYASKLETEKIKERTMRGKRESARGGKIPHGGFARLYGYDYDKTTKKRLINESEAYWVRQMFTWLVEERLSTNAVTYRLRALKAPAKRSQYWNRSSVIAILKNPAYTGKTYAFTFCQGTNQRRPQEEWMEIADATPAIIAVYLFEAAQAQLKLNNERAKRNTRQQYLLRSHLYCRQCGRVYCGHMDRNIGYYRCPGKNRITSPVSRCLNKNWRADRIEALVWEKIESFLGNPELIMNVIEKQRNEAGNPSILEAELQQTERQLRELDREQKQLLQWALKGFPEETVEAENKRINDAKTVVRSKRTMLETQIDAGRKASITLPKLEEYVDLIRGKLTTLDYDMKRLALDMLDIKVWVDGLTVEIIGSIPVEDVAVVTTSS
ncbi:recombinase family protein [Chloroflexota bacterium]